MNKQILREVLKGYAWPGGYPLALGMADGGVLCPKCVRENIRTIIRHTRSQDIHSGWCALDVFVNWEDDHLTCDCCNELIESAYGNE